MRTAFFAIQLVALSIAMAASAAKATSSEPDKDPQTRSVLDEARQLIDRRKAAAAIERCDKVIEAFKAYYGGSKQTIYCARTSAESLGYLLKAGTEKKSAVALSSLWADAYFMKAYALQDLGRLADAKVNARLAIALSPFNSQYHSELGEIYQLEKNWAKAKQEFEEAEDHANLSPLESKAHELGVARRGLGYTFVELGKLDEAEKKYQQCLTANRNDAKAKAELEYVRQQKAKRKAR